MREIIRFRPDVVITFDPHGMYGHPDHLAVGQAATNAVWRAADPSLKRAHRVQKMYYRVFTDSALEAYQQTFGELKMQVRADERGGVGWQPWAVTTRVDTNKYAELAWRAITSHRSQVVASESLRQTFDETRATDLGTETYFRVLGQGTGSWNVEENLFEGVAVAVRAAH